MLISIHAKQKTKLDTKRHEFLKKKLIMGFAVAIFVYYAILFLIISSFFYQGYYVLEPVEQEKFRAIYDKWQNFDEKEFDSLVANITSGKTDTYGKAESIFQYMNINLKNLNILAKHPVNVKDFDYGRHNPKYFVDILFCRDFEYNLFYIENGTTCYFRKIPPDSVWVYVTGYGRCGEYSTLFNTLATAANVEARMVQPYYENGTNYDHMWNEVRLENGTWFYVDTSWPTDTPIGKPCNYLENRIDKTKLGKIEVFNTGEDLTSKYICKEQP